MNNVKITVIMPVFNVEKYISNALDSVLEQEGTNISLEVIVVDDGSTDHTKRIIKQYQDKHEMITLLEENGIGPGQARNIAIDQSTGDYIAFIDGDDILYPKSYEKMLASAQKNDADIVVGNVSRFDSTREFFLSGLHKKIFSDELVGTHIMKYPYFLYDTTSWNKLFKTSFLKDNHIKFPEGILYEDIPFNMEAHIKSGNTNVILDYVYKWQLRDAVNKSITQSRHDQKNMLDRITAMNLFNDIITEEKVENKELLELKELKELNIDLKLYLDQYAEVDEEYLNKFSDSVINYVANMKTDVFETKLSAVNRIKYQLLMEKRYDDLILFNENISEFYQLKTIQEGQKIYKDISSTRFKSLLNQEKVDLTSDIIPNTKVKNITWNESELSIEGFAYLSYLNTSKETNIEATLVNFDETKSIMLPVTVIKDKSTTQIYGGGKKDHLIKRHVNYDYSSYLIKIDTLNESIHPLLEEDCFIKLKITNGNHTQETYVGNPSKGYKVRPKDQVINDTVYNIGYNKMWRLKLTSLLIGGFIDKVSLEEDEVVIVGQVINDLSYGAKLLNYSHDFEVKPRIHYLENQRFKVTVSLKDISDIPYGESFYLMFEKNGKNYKVEMTEQLNTSFYIYNKNELCLEKTRNNRLKILLEEDIHPMLSEITITTGSKESYDIKLSVNQYLPSFEKDNDVCVHIEGTRNSDGNVLTLHPTNQTCHENNVLSHYSIKVSEEDLSLFGNSSWLFNLIIKMDGNTEKRVIMTEELQECLSFKIKKNNFKLRKSAENYVKLDTSLDKGYFDKGPRRMKFLKEYLYPKMMMKLPQKRNYVMFESYWGKSYSCNPKAIYEDMLKEYPNMVGIWSFNNPYTEIKGPGKKVRRNSWQYYYYLARSKYFINNVNWPTEYIKRKSSVEVQTLHGTFLKTMGLDVEDEIKTTQQLKEFRLRHGRWDYLVSPSSFMTTIAKRVFEFDGEMLEYGFPRNDLLVRTSSEKESIDALKETLHIPKDKKVILYAPTYRNKSGFNLELDIRKMKEKLSDDYVLLVRLHYFVAKSIDLTGVEDFVVNVCNYPDVQELLLLTDVLITDYSSIMFDYANLKKPMIFFTYDLEYYRDVLRGMYLDFEAEAPGKLCKETDELITCLDNLETYEKEYQESADVFHQKFNEFETGKASNEILKRILE